MKHRASRPMGLTFESNDPDAGEDAVLGAQVERLVQTHFAKNAAAEAKEGSHVMSGYARGMGLDLSNLLGSATGGLENAPNQILADVLGGVAANPGVQQALAQQAAQKSATGVVSWIQQNPGLTALGAGAFLLIPFVLLLRK